MIGKPSSGRRRNGVILVVVVSLLALFAVIGLGYVIYAESAATAARMERERQEVVGSKAEIAPELVLNAALARLIYDSPDDQTGVFNSSRGHSLARSIYGWNSPANTGGINTNVVPFNGTGRLKYLEGVNPATGTPIAGWPLSFNLPWDQIINYTPRTGDSIVRHPERYPLDPAQLSHYPTLTSAGQTTYFGGYNQPYTYPDLNNVFLAAVRASDGQVLVPSFHRPWLVPDPTTGATDFLGNPLNPEWYTQSGRLKVLRPRPIDQLRPDQLSALGIPGLIPDTDATATKISKAANYFSKLKPLIDQGKLMPFPTDLGGDVKNLPGSPGGNDSVWIDMGFPVRSTRDGKKYKPLVAFLIRDLDSLVNINAAGNLKGTNQVVELPPVPSPASITKRYTNAAHVSNQGLGRHEINVQKVLNPGGVFAVAAEYPRLFGGNTAVAGRYASTGIPPVAYSSLLNPATSPDPASMPNNANLNLSLQPVYANSRFAPCYFPLDDDGSRQDIAGSFRAIPLRGYDYSQMMDRPLTLSSFPDAYSMPPVNTAPLTGNVPAYTGTIFGINPIANTAYDNDHLQERLSHPLWYNPVRKTGYSRLLDAQEMHRLHARYDSPLDWQDSVLSKLLPQTLQSPAVRHSITLLSADVARPGLVPQTVTPLATGQATYTITHMAPYNDVPYAATGETFMYPFTSYQGAMLNYTVFPFANAAATALPNDFQGNPATIVDLPSGKKQLVPGYSTNDGRGQLAGIRERVDLNRPLRPYPLIIGGVGTASAYMDSSNPIVMLEARQAAEDRRQFASDIFRALCLAVGVKSPATPTYTLGSITNGQPSYDPLIEAEFITYKYLAQIAANIVDDIDDDDIMTQFQWTNIDMVPVDQLFTKGAVVVGVEMPKVVINEVYIEQTNGPQGDSNYVLPPSGSPPQRRAAKYQINVWVELHNTMVPPDTVPANYAKFRANQAQWLRNGPPAGTPYPAYLVHLVKTTATTPVVGVPPATDSPDAGGMAKTLDFMSAPAAATVIYPVNPSTTGANPPSSYTSSDIDNVKNEGFYVAGPDQIDMLQTPGRDLKPSGAMNPLASISSSALRFDSPPAGAVDNNSMLVRPKVVLQRLANPYLPPNNVAGPDHNPFVTVDVMDVSDPMAPLVPPPGFAPVNRSVRYIGLGNAPPTYNTIAPKSVARRQPFAGFITRLDMQQSNPPVPGQPSHSMMRHNGMTPMPPAALPDGTLERFDWFVHHDRKLTSPIELIHVPDTAPWQVTQRFIHTDASPTNNVIRQGHTAPWLDEREKIDTMTGDPTTGYGPKIPLVPGTPPNPPVASSRLYRALEMFRTGDRSVEMAFGGRDIGKVNINTIYDKATFDAICDAVNRSTIISGTPVSMTSAALGFTQADVNFAWDALTNDKNNLTARTGRLTDPGIYTQITGRDMPFWGMGAAHAQEVFPPAPTPAAQYPAVATGVPTTPYVQNSGINATLFRKIVQPIAPPPTLVYNRSRIFDAEGQFTFITTPLNPSDPNTTSPPPPVRHPMLEKSLLAKIFEHLTTRSNVFAVYMTVGYFEVTDSSQKPELLGDEIGMLRDAVTGSVVENKAIRHRMFAIVDRTNLTLQPPNLYVSTNPWYYADEDQRKQGPAPFYYSGRPEPLFPSNVPFSGTPATSIDGVLLGSAFPGLWAIKVPVTGLGPQDTTAPMLTSTPPVLARTSASGTYNGIGWVLNAAPYNANVTGNASILYVDTGAEQRRMAVRAIVPSPTSPDYAIIILGVPNLTARNWPPLFSLDPSLPDCALALPTPRSPVTITNAIAGNPGPQMDFDHKQPNHRGVVLYSVIMD